MNKWFMGDPGSRTVFFIPVTQQMLCMYVCYYKYWDLGLCIDEKKIECLCT